MGQQHLQTNLANPNIWGQRWWIRNIQPTWAMIHGFERLYAVIYWGIMCWPIMTHRGNSHQTTSIRRWQRSLNSAQICSVIYNGFLGLNHKRFGDDMVKITGWWQMVQECLSCFMVTPSDVTRNPAILSLQALELCSTVGQLQWSLWKLFALRFSVLLNLSHYDLTCCHSDRDSGTPNWCDNGFQERRQKHLMIEQL